MSRLVPHFILKSFKHETLFGEFNAYCIFIDISGFTAITQSLMSIGKEGAEILSCIINDIFTPSIHAVYNNNGFVSSFGGDSFTAIFQTESAEYPLRSAFIINRLFRENGVVNTKIGKFELYVKIGLSWGIIKFSIVDAVDQKTFFFRGDAVNNCAISEHKADKMQIIADEYFTEKLNIDIEKEKVAEKWYLLTPSAINTKDNFQSPEILEHKDMEHHFIPKEVRELKQKGEFREICTCFISFCDDHDLHGNIKEIMRKCNEYGGYFNRVDFGDKGAVILILFGAPRGMEKLYHRAAEFAICLRNIRGLTFRLGLTKGTSWTGFAGSNQRCEYTALGNKVNLAARLMMKADWGDILTGPDIREEIADQYDLGSAGCFKFKGFSEKVKVYNLRRRSSQNQHISYTGTFIGRRNEAKILNEFTSPVFNNRFGGIIYIDGPAGIGKTRFIHEWAKSFKKNECNFFYLLCDGILRKPFYPFKHFFKYYFDQDENNGIEKNKEHFLKIYKSLIHKTENEKIRNELIRTESVIGSLIGLEWEGSLFSELDKKGRYNNILYSVKNFFLAESRTKPFVMFIEDAHSIDADSSKLLAHLIYDIDESPFIILAVCRPEDNGNDFIFSGIDKSLSSKRLKLPGFTKKMVSKLIVDKLNIKKTKIPDKTKDLIWKKSGGNPFFAEQLIIYMLEKDIFNYDLSLKNKVFSIPSGINQIIVARIDRLNSKLKEIIKTASVLGREFFLNVLKELLFIQNIAEDENDFYRQVNRIKEEQIWECISETKYLFKNALIRDTVYDIQLKESLRNLHDLAGNTLETLNKDNLYPMYEELANHYDRAKNKIKALEYSKKAGEKSRKEYLNEQAYFYFERLLEYLDREKDSEKFVETLLKMGELSELTGEWTKAEKAYADALKISKDLDDDSLLVDCLNHLGYILDYKGEIKKAITYLNQALETSYKSGYMAGHGLASGYMGNLHYYQGNYDTAMGHYKKQVEIFEQLNDKRRLISAINNIGNVYLHRGEFEKAIQHYEKQLIFCREIGDKYGYALAVGNIGYAYSHMEEFDKAMQFYNEKLTICKQLQDKFNIGNTFDNMGIIYIHKNDYEKALKCFEKQLSISKELGNKRGISTSIGNMGNVHMNMEDYKKAMEFYKKQLSISKELNDKRCISIAYGNIGHIYKEWKDYDNAIRYYEEKEALCKDMKDKYGLYIAYFELACLKTHIKDYSGALDYYDKAIGLKREQKDQDGLARLLHEKDKLSKKLQ